MDYRLFFRCLGRAFVLGCWVWIVIWAIVNVFYPLAFFSWPMWLLVLMSLAVGFHAWFTAHCNATENRQRNDDPHAPRNIG